MFANSVLFTTVNVPPLSMAPPLLPVFPVRLQFVTVSVPLLKIAPPPTLGELPPAIVRPEMMVVAPKLTEKMPKALLPWMVCWEALVPES